MHAMRTVPLAVKAALICLLPLLACSSYYTIDRLGPAGTLLTIAASLAAPVLLVSVAGTAVLATAGRASRLALWLAAGVAVASAGLLLRVWL